MKPVGQKLAIGGNCILIGV